MLDVLADELRQPVFPAEHVEKVRGLRMTALAERENDTRQMAGLAFRELCFPDHPLGYTLLGTRETNHRINRDALVEFYETYYRPEGMVVVVVGAVAAEEAVRRSRRPSATGPAPCPAARTAADRPTERGLAPAGAHARQEPIDIVLGWPAMRRLDPDYEAARLANTVLGVFGMMGRLGTKSASGRAWPTTPTASFMPTAARSLGLVAGVNPANVERRSRPCWTRSAGCAKSPCRRMSWKTASAT